jgi:hypothetical protein
MTEHMVSGIIHCRVCFRVFVLKRDFCTQKVICKFENL